MYFVAEKESRLVRLAPCLNNTLAIRLLTVLGLSERMLLLDVESGCQACLIP